MAIDHAARAAKLKRREAALARAHAQRPKHPHAGFYYDIDRGARRNGAKSLPASNTLLRDVLLWKPRRNQRRRASYEGQLCIKMNGRENGGEMEMDDEKLIEVVGEKKEVGYARHVGKEDKRGKSTGANACGNGEVAKSGEDGDEDADDGDGEEDLRYQWDLLENLTPSREAASSQ
jgi:hypothetical protein